MFFLAISKFSQEQVSDIIEKYLNGMSSLELAEEYNCQKSTICRILKRNGIERRKGQFESPYSYDEHWLDDIDTPEKAYFLGFFYADGCNDMKQNRIVVSLKEEDEYLLERFSQFFKSDRPLTVNNQKKGNIIFPQKVFTLRGKYICKRLSELGAVSQKTTILKWDIENIMKTELFSHFIRGFFDGDGCISLIYNKSGSCRAIIDFVGGSFEFMNTLKEFLEKELGISIYLRQRGEHKYEMSFSKKDSVLKFKKYIYKDCSICLDRKFQKFVEFENNKL